MSSLPDFLEQIGAAELPSAVSAPAQDSPPPLGALLARIQDEITAVNDQTRALLLAEWPQFTAQVQTGQLLLGELDQEEHDLHSLERSIHGEDAILPPLVSALKEHRELATAHANSSATIALLTSLLDLHTRVQAVADLTTAGALPNAVGSLSSLISFQSNDAPERWISSTDSWRSLERWAVEERARLETAIVTAVESCFELSLSKEGDNDHKVEGEPLATLRLRKSVAAAPGAEELTLTSLLDSLGQIYELPSSESKNSKGRSVEHHLANVAKQLLKHFVVPFLTAAGSASAPPLSFGYATSPTNANEQLVSLLPVQPHHAPLTMLSKFLAYFASHSSLIPSAWAPSFTKHLTPPLQTALIDSFLSPSLPTLISSLPDYIAILVAASGFEGEFLPQGGWFAFLPPSAEGGAPVEEATVIKAWMARVDRHWAKRVGDSALARVRQVVKANDWKGDEVQTEVVDIIQAPPPPPPERVATPPPPAPVVVAPPKPKIASPIVEARPFSPVIQTPQLSPSPAVTPAPRPGKLGTRIGPPASTTPIPVKPKTGSKPIPVKVRAAAPPPVVQPGNHNTRESVAQLAGAGLVSAGIAQVIARADPKSPPPPPVPHLPQGMKSPPLPAAANTTRSPSIGSRSRSPTMPRRGSIVSHAPVTKVEPSETDEPDWEMAGSPVIDPVAELGWGSGGNFFDVLGSGTLDPVVESAEKQDEVRKEQAKVEEEADLEGGGDGWDLDEPVQESESPAEEKRTSVPLFEVDTNGPKPVSPPLAAAEPQTPASLPPLIIPSPKKEPALSNEYEPAAQTFQDTYLPSAATQPAAEISHDEILPTTRSRAGSELESAGAELTSPTSPLAKSVSALVPENTAALVNGAVAAGLGVVGSAASLFRSGGEQEDLEAGQAEDDGWGIEEEGADEEQGWPLESAPVAPYEQPLEQLPEEVPESASEPVAKSVVEQVEVFEPVSASVEVDSPLSPPLPPRSRSPSPVLLDDGLTPIDYSAELAALSPSPTTSHSHRYPWQRESVHFFPQAVAPQPRVRSLSLTEEALVTPPNESAIGAVREEDYPHEELLTAHDYLSPQGVDLHTPQPSATPEEFIIPGDLENAIPAQVFVPEQVDERFAYDHSVHQASYERPQQEEASGWDIEEGAPAEEQRLDEPSHETQPAVEAYEPTSIYEPTSAYEPTSTYEPVSHPVYDEEAGPADDSWEIEDGPEPGQHRIAEQPEFEGAQQVPLLESVVSQPVPDAQEVVAPVLTAAESEPVAAVEPEEHLEEAALAEAGWDLEEQAEEPVDVEQAEEVHALEERYNPIAERESEPQVEMHIEQPDYVSPAAPTAVEVESAEEEEDGWDLEEQVPAEAVEDVQEAAPEPADFAPVIPGYEDQPQPEQELIEPAPGSLTVEDLALESEETGWGIEDEEVAHEEPEIQPDELAQQTIEAGFPAAVPPVGECYAQPEPEFEPEAEEEGWGIEGEGEYDEESAPYVAYAPPPPVQHVAPPAPAPVASYEPEPELETEANGADDGWGLGDDEVDEEAAYDYTPEKVVSPPPKASQTYTPQQVVSPPPKTSYAYASPAQIVSPPPRASAPSSASKATNATRTPQWAAAGSPVVHPPTPRDQFKFTSPTPAARPLPVKQTVVPAPPPAKPAFIPPLARDNLSVPQRPRAGSFGSEASGNSGGSGEDAWGFEEDLGLTEGFDDEPQPQAAPIVHASVYSPPPSNALNKSSSSYTFSPPSSSHAFDPPAELEEEAVDDGWGFELDEGDDEDGEAMRLRGGAYGAEEEADEPDWGMKSPPIVMPGQKIRRRKEPMMISAASKQLVQIAEEVLTDALAVGEPSFKHPTFAAASEPLFGTFLSLFALYRATAPVQHAQLLETVPALGMQFANDALWMAEELERMWDRLGKGHAGPDEARKTAQVTDAVKRMKKMGTDWREKQVTIQRQVLMESLDEAKAFLYTADKARYADCERALQQVIHSLHRLANVWKSVLNPAVLHHTLGGLINDVLQRVLNEIEDQQDISEEESHRLNDLCKLLHELESLFEGSGTSIGREVPTYFKFVFLSELLEASMADVLFLFDNGHLVDFAPREIAKLVRALFADSPLRAKNLDHIMLGHPDVPVGGAEEDSEGEGRW